MCKLGKNVSGHTADVVCLTLISLVLNMEYRCLLEIISCIWNTDQKYLESFEMWCWKRIEKFSSTDHVRNEEVLLRVNEQRNILHEIR